MTDHEGAGLVALAPGDVHVWLARPSTVTDATLARCVALLTEEERERVSRFRFERHRREAAVSKALVRATLARYVGRPSSALRYRFGRHGRPFVDPPCGVYFNATNHPELVACAVSVNEEIGVDLEPVSRGDEILECARTVFASPELAALRALPADAQRDRAVSLWTCKEAYIKALGVGFAAPLLEIAVDFSPGRRPRLRCLSAFDEPDGWWLDTRDLTGFRIAVAMRGGGADVKLVLREIDWAGLEPASSVWRG